MDTKNIKVKEDELRKNSYELKLRYIDSVSETESIFTCKICNEVYKLDNEVVNNKKFKCDICVEAEKLDILEKKGISLEYRDKGKRVYKYNKCNHYVTISSNKIIDYDMECKECKLNSLKEEAKIVGLELLLEVNDKYGWYKFSECNHTQKIQFSDISDSINCQTCQIEKNRIEARSVGLQYIDSINKEYGLYRCSRCNTEHKFSFSEIKDMSSKNIKISCKKCVSIVK